MRFKINHSLLILLLLPTLLILIWFRHGNIMATGESGIPFYDLDLQFETNKYSWALYALGHPTNISVVSTPTYWFLSLIQKAGVPSFVIQAAFFWIILVTSGLGIYFLTKQFFPKLEEKYLILAVLFYWFNPISMVNIWNRFLNNFLFFYALLPVVLLLFMRGIILKRYVYAIHITLISIIFSYAFTSVAFDLIFWFVISYTTFFYLFAARFWLDRLFTLKFFLLVCILWSVTNFWWISQVLSYIYTGGFQVVASSSFSPSHNYQTFSSLSGSLGQLGYLFRLEHRTFFNNEDIWWIRLYDFPPIIFLEFIFILVIFLSIFFKKSKSTLFLGTFFIISILLAKGNSPPLGEITDEIFKKIYFLQVLRNPFEKFGFLIILTASPLFAKGTFILIERIKNFYWQKLLFGFIVFWITVIWGGVVWTSLIFTSPETPANQFNVGYQVKVPLYYKEAAEWLNSQNDDFRLIVLPLGGEGITYKWEKGYSGVELSNQILPKTSVSFNTNIPFYDQVSKNIENIFLTRDDFPKIMRALSAKYIMFRWDIDWRERKMRNPQTIVNRLRTLESKRLFKKVKGFGNISFWEPIEREKSNPSDTYGEIYIATKLKLVSGSVTIDDILFNQSSNNAIFNGGDKIFDNSNMLENIVHPMYKFSLFSKQSGYDFGLRSEVVFPAIKFLPSSVFYNFILIKEKLELEYIKDTRELIIKKISLLGKRLVEAEKEKEKNNIKAINRALDGYLTQFRAFLPLLSQDKLGSRDNQLDLQEAFYKVFNKHFELLNQLKSKVSEKDQEIIVKIEEELKTGLKSKGIIPSLGYLESESFPIINRVVYQFFIEEEGEYELFLDSKNWGKHFQTSINSPFLFQIDQDFVLRNGKISDNDLVSYGFLKLYKGLHEIGWNIPQEITLIDAPKEFVLAIDHGVLQKQFDIKNFEPNSLYALSFDYLIKKGNGFQLIIQQNNDPYRNYEISPIFSKTIGPDYYDYEKKDLNEFFLSSPSADMANLIFKVTPWNNCEEIFFTEGKDRCEDFNFRKPYDRTTEVIINNIKIVKRTESTPLLKRISSNMKSILLPKINYQKINPSEYRVSVNGASQSFLLILNQLYDPGWKVFTVFGEQLQPPHFLANTYSNGWLMKKEGDYDLIIKFVPQDLLDKAEKISIFSLVIVTVIFAGWIFKKHVKIN